MLAWMPDSLRDLAARCLTIGIELMLASDIRVAASDTRSSQIEVKRGIFPTGGATWRFFRDAGWGSAMRYILTGDEFGAEDVLRMGLVPEVGAGERALGRQAACCRREG